MVCLTIDKSVNLFTFFWILVNNGYLSIGLHLYKTKTKKLYDVGFDTSACFVKFKNVACSE